MKFIEDKYISSSEERDFLLQALYEFLLNFDVSFSATENINIILSECNKILTTEKVEPDLWTEVMEKQAERLNVTFNLKKMMLHLKKQIEILEPLLQKIIGDEKFRTQVREELEGELFEEPSYSNRFLDTFVKVFGNHLGCYQRK